MKLTSFNHIGADWKRIKNHCRTTVNKQFTDCDATEGFKRALCISEHSPLRLFEVDWTWADIPYWVSTEWSRHKFEKFITSQRDDRRKGETSRKDKPQGALVNFDGYANAQNLIDAWRKRLCRCATKEARTYAEDFKFELHSVEPEVADVLVPNCVYRGGCPEFTTCGFWEKFKKAYPNVGNMTIQERYAAYNKLFYKERTLCGNESRKT